MNRVLSLFSTAFGLHDCPSVVTIDSKTVTSIWLWSVLNIREGKDNMLKLDYDFDKVGTIVLIKQIYNSVTVVSRMRLLSNSNNISVTSIKILSR